VAILYNICVLICVCIYICVCYIGGRPRPIGGPGLGQGSAFGGGGCHYPAVDRMARASLELWGRTRTEGVEG
jgi:hypothetical protein